MNNSFLFATFHSMNVIIYISIAYLVLTSAVLIWNFFKLQGLSSISANPQKNSPLVSICIPARNEEKVIDRCVTSALKQSYPNFEVLVLDDNSTDKTTDILKKFSGIIANLHYLKGKPKPDDWLGKPWACQQLSEQAKGDYLIFIDADVWLEETAIQKAIKALQTADAITVWPKQVFGSFWERMVIPLVYHALYSLLPAHYVEKDPKWRRKYFDENSSIEFAAACGQFLAFNKSAYENIGGHQSVKDEIVEDVELAKNLKRNEFVLKMYYGTGTVNCRMYHSNRELWHGFRKNFFAGFNYKIAPFVLMSLLNLLAFILPFILMAFSLVENHNQLLNLSLIAISLIYFQRLLLDIRFGWNFLYSLFHPVAVLWFQSLAVRSVVDYFTNKKLSWKGREL